MDKGFWTVPNIILVAISAVLLVLLILVIVLLCRTSSLKKQVVANQAEEEARAVEKNTYYNNALREILSIDGIQTKDNIQFSLQGLTHFVLEKTKKGAFLTVNLYSHDSMMPVYVEIRNDESLKKALFFIDLVK